MKDQKFNYVIGRYWSTHGGAISAYTVFNSEVHYGTEQAAFTLCQHVREATMDDSWRVFRLMDMGTYYDPDPC